MVTFFAGQTPPAALLEDLVDDWDTYVPVWSTSGTQPVIGNGVLTGRYKQIGKLVVVKAGILAGTTTTFGTGQWNLSLPVNHAQPGSPLNDPYAGVWHGWDNSVPANWVGWVVAANATQMTFHTNTGAAAVGGVTATGPITWANLDRFLAMGTYQAA